MAIKTGARFKPDVNRDPLQTTNEALNKTTGAGTTVMPVQLIAWNDAKIADINAVDFGDPAVEKFITVLDEDVLRADIAVVGGMTNANAKAFWDAQLSAFYATYSAAALTNLARTIFQARRTGAFVGA